MAAHSFVVEQPGASAAHFTLGVLLYGPHVELARRCLSEKLLLLVSAGAELRIGMNECCAETRDFVAGLRQRYPQISCYERAQNVGKYPLQRAMFYDPDRPLQRDYVMWFDDDSYLTATDPQAWLARVEREMLRSGTDMLGATYYLRLQGNEHLWIQTQPWYTANPPAVAGQRTYFVTGGWWVMRPATFQAYNWPWPELLHNGGDSMWGELMRQQGLRCRCFREGVAINADAAGRESAAPRRGWDHVRIGV